MKKAQQDDESRIRNARDLNLVNMISNIESNNKNDFQKIRDLYSVYANMKRLDFNEEFKNSIENSKRLINSFGTYPFIDSIKQLKLNEPNSFLVLPLCGKGHLWSTLVRRTDEGFSVLVINKGLRYWHDPVEEFVYKKEDYIYLSSQLSRGAFSNQNVEDVYRNIILQSDKQYNLKITTSPQKVGNCFTKNIQAAIKIAYATRDFTSQNMKSYRIDKKYTPFGTPDKNKITFKWNTIDTKNMQRLFAHKVGLTNPEIRRDIEESIDIYTSNKNFRLDLKNSKDPRESLLIWFDPKNLYSNMEMNERVKFLLKKVTPHTYSSNRKALDFIVSKVNDPKYRELYQNVDSLASIANKLSTNLYFNSFLEAKHDFIKSLDTCFDKKGLYNDLHQRERTKILIEKLDPKILQIHKSKVEEALSYVYGNENVSREYKRIFLLSQKSYEAIKNFKPLQEGMLKESKYFPRVVGEMKSIFKAYEDFTKEKSNSPILSTSSRYKTSPTMS